MYAVNSNGPSTELYGMPNGMREHTWQKSKLEVHKQMFREQCKLVNDMLLHVKTTFYSEKIRAIGKDQKKLLVATNTLLNRNNNTKLPSHESRGLEHQISQALGKIYTHKLLPTGQVRREPLERIACDTISVSQSVSLA